MGLFCLGAIYYFSGVAEDVRDAEPATARVSAGRVERHYGPNAPPKRQALSPPTGRSKASLVMLVLQAQGPLSDRADAGLRDGWKETIPH